MAEIDYQLALLLQHQFEQEAKKPKEYKSDIELARTLQEQFKTENEIATPKNGLVYNTTKNPLNSSKCLIDPSWEVIDPTPDIHVLFMAFNQRFFWGTLEAVCVSWGKRMTSCAGICSYQGRAGLCSITLSEPLLKLRPRKDLVETLLHEMIHAHLFITNNNRDRDGHGPEFCKHMYRINREAGTNITIYHNFIDEVRLYQQHWWRCNGPCQRYVRRAMNRAPGPNDRWWGEHTATCGGSFIKVKEPEKSVKKGPTKETVKPKEDIRKYVSLTKPDPASTPIAKPTSTVTSGQSGFNGTNTFNNNDRSRDAGKNEIEIADMNGNESSCIKKGSKDATVTPCLPPTSTKDTLEYSVVRNHWLNKFSNGSSGVKRKITGVPPKKVPKLSTSNVPQAAPLNETSECPVCLELMALAQLNAHLDECLKQPKTEDCVICRKAIPVGEYERHVNECVDQLSAEEQAFKPCSLCRTMVPIEEFDLHAEKCLLELYDQMGETCKEVKKNVDCLACGKEIVRADLNEHLEVCKGLEDVFSDDNVPVEGESVFTRDKEKTDMTACLFCNELVVEEKIADHMSIYHDFS